MEQFQDKNTKAILSLLSTPSDEEFAKKNLQAINGHRKLIIGRNHLYVISSLAASLLILLSVLSHYQKNYSTEAPIIVTSAFAYNEISTGAGQIRTISLEDGSRIYMNAMSTIRYPKHFATNVRKVDLLDGEAYFEVANNKNAPFIVSTSQMDIKVLGTTFNVFAYSGHNVKTTLLDGSIFAYPTNNETKGIVLSEKESAIFSENSIVVSNDNNENYSWTSGKYSFSNNTLKEIISSLELYYDISFSISDNTLSEHRFSGKFRNENDVTVILQTLQKAYPFQYSFNGDKIEIY